MIGYTTKWDAIAVAVYGVMDFGCQASAGWAIRLLQTPSQAFQFSTLGFRRCAVADLPEGSGLLLRELAEEGGRVLQLGLGQCRSAT
ncbi:hypothetical protein [Streptomyces sp. NPDC127105]|uniref:hypothetical protein n=1 Tax=Streptomyces sp. NPDC127105 TaxID=3345359 RepID=UPI0036678A10